MPKKTASDPKFVELETKVAAEVAKSKSRQEALRALDPINEILVKVNQSRKLLLRALSEDNLTEKQRQDLIQDARWELDEVEDLMKKV